VHCVFSLTVGVSGGLHMCDASREGRAQRGKWLVDHC